METFLIIGVASLLVLVLMTIWVFGALPKEQGGKSSAGKVPWSNLAALLEEKPVKSNRRQVL